MKKASLGVFKIVIESITCASSFEVSELLSFLIISLGRNIEGSLGIFEIKCWWGHGLSFYVWTCIHIINVFDVMDMLIFSMIMTPPPKKPKKKKPQTQDSSIIYSANSSFAGCNSNKRQ